MKRSSLIIFTILFCIPFMTTYVHANGCIEGNCNKGQGIRTYTSGNQYSGQWKDGKRNGKGKMFNPIDKIETIGVWRNDNFYKKILLPSYKVLLKRGGITGIEFIKNSAGIPGTIDVLFIRSGTEENTISPVPLQTVQYIQKLLA